MASVAAAALELDEIQMNSLSNAKLPRVAADFSLGKLLEEARARGIRGISRASREMLLEKVRMQRNMIL